MNMQYFAKLLITMGLGITVFGFLLYFGGKLGLGRLPGDIYIKREGFTFYFPVVTCILASIILSIVFGLLRK